MTISLSTNVARQSYAVSQGATQSAFTVSFAFFDDDDLNVFVDGTLKTLTTHYTVSGGDGSAGSVTMTSGNEVTGITGGSTVVITRDIDLDRTTDFPSSGPFAVATLNTELDKITAQFADRKDVIDRSIRLQDQDEAQSMELPLKASRLGKVLAFNASTGAVEAGPTIADTQTLAAITADIGTLADIEDGTDATNAIQTVAGIASSVSSVAAKASLITSDFVSDLNTLAVTDVINDINTLATSDIVSDLNTLASSDFVSDLNTLATSDVVSDMNTLATSANVTNMATLGASGVVANIATVAGVSSAISTVAGISSNVSTVAGDSTDIQTIASNISTIAAKANAGANSDITSLSGLTTALSVAQGGTGATSASAARTALGIGTIATQASDSVSITGGSVAGITDLGIADGGTGASSASAARTNLGLEIGSDVQAFDADTVKKDVNNTFTAAQRGSTDTDTSNTGSVTLNFDTNQNFVLTLTGNVTLANPSTEAVGQSGFIVFIQDGTGGRTVSLGTDYETAAGAGLTLSSAASTTDIVPYVVAASGRILLGNPQLAFS